MTKRSIAVDMTGHNGLRGAAALWVMVFHCFSNCDYIIALQGSSIMPLFFMLSGFALTVAYHKPAAKPAADLEMQSTYTAVATGDDSKEAEVLGSNSSPEPATEANVAQPAEAATTDENELNVYKFHRNRFARVFPVYYVCNILAIPYWCAGYGRADPHTWQFPASMIVSLVPVSTLFLNLLGESLDSPAWTVGTLAFMWLCFPTLLKTTQQLSDQQLVRRTCNMFWIQLLFILFVFFLLLGTLGFWHAFTAASMWPPGRLPIFLMGMYAGELSLRQVGKRYPWQPSFLALFPPLFCSEDGCCTFPVNLSSFYHHPISIEEKEAEERDWASVLDHRSIQIVVMMVIVTGLDALTRYATGGFVLGMVWLQGIIPYLQLQIMVALTRDKGQAKVSQFLRSSSMQWVGEISACIYLIHYVVIRYTAWAVHQSPIPYAEFYDCSKYNDPEKHADCERDVDKFREGTTIPLWSIPIVIAVSMILATGLYYGVEEPMRKRLRV
ncbi:acyltransferase [archaeon]|nr:MAG: acyltransferase [archaeon]